MTVDPLVDATGQPYDYTGDDPVNGVDPDGLDCGIFSVVCGAYDATAGGVKSVGNNIASEAESQWNHSNIEICGNLGIAEYCEGDYDGHVYNSYGVGLGIPGATVSQGSYCPYGTSFVADANFGVGGGVNLGTGNPSYFYEIGSPGGGGFLLHTRSGFLPPLLEGF